MRDFDRTKKKNGKSIRLSLLPKNEAWALLAVHVGLLLCGTKDHAQLFRRVADVFDGKSPVDSVDDHNMLDVAYKNAQDALIGMFNRGRPTFAEFAKCVAELTGRHLTRRDAKGYPLQPKRRGAPHGRRQKEKAARVAPCGRLS